MFIAQKFSDAILKLVEMRLVFSFSSPPPFFRPLYSRNDSSMAIHTYNTYKPIKDRNANENVVQTLKFRQSRSPRNSRRNPLSDAKKFGLSSTNLVKCWWAHTTAQNVKYELYYFISIRCSVCACVCVCVATPLVISIDWFTLNRISLILFASLLLRNTHQTPRLNSLFLIPKTLFFSSLFFFVYYFVSFFRSIGFSSRIRCFLARRFTDTSNQSKLWYFHTKHDAESLFAVGWTNCLWIVA